MRATVTDMRLAGRVWCCGLAFCLIVVTACERGADSPPPPPAVSVSVETPEDTASSLLHLLCARCDAIARHDAATADACRDSVVRQLLSRDDVLAAYLAGPFAQQHASDGILPKLVESWAAIISYYADGLELERMELLGGRLGGNLDQAVVNVPAEARGSRTIIQVGCRLVGGEWRVVQLTLAPQAMAPTHTPPQPPSESG